MNARIITCSSIPHQATVEVLGRYGEIVATASFAPGIIEPKYAYGNQAYAEACAWLENYRTQTQA